MPRQLSRIGQLSCLLASLALFLVGCDGGSKDSSTGDPASASQPSAAALAVLAKADAADGAADKVISKCLTCNLGMDGDPQHVARVGAYQLHLCSAECKAKFEEAPENALLSVNIPE